MTKVYLYIILIIDNYCRYQIRLSEAQPLDSGYFICHASNPYGQQTRRIQLLVQGDFLSVCGFSFNNLPFDFK